MRKALALMICLVGSTVAADTFDGVYRQVANADCSLIGVDGGAVEIRDGVFHGVETDCRMADPVDVIDMDGVLYRMQCSNGDTQWTERAMLMHKAERDGIIMVWNGYAFVYDSCPVAADQLPIKD